MLKENRSLLLNKLMKTKDFLEENCESKLTMVKNEEIDEDEMYCSRTRNTNEMIRLRRLKRIVLMGIKIR